MASTTQRFLHVTSWRPYYKTQHCRLQHSYSYFRLQTLAPTKHCFSDYCELLHFIIIIIPNVQLETSIGWLIMFILASCHMCEHLIICSFTFYLFIFIHLKYVFICIYFKNFRKKHKKQPTM